MIATILSLLAGVGVPAVITGIIGKLVPGLLGPLLSGTIGKFLSPIIHLCMGLVDIILMLLKWVMQKIIAGLDHIVKSVPATLTVLLLMYGSYAYGDRLEHITGERGQPRAVQPAQPIPPLPTRPNATPPRTQTPGDWIRRILKG